MQTNEHTDELIKAAVAVDNLSIQHRIEFRPAEALQFAGKCDQHGHTTDQLVGLIGKINQTVPPMDFGSCNGKPNPNNGHPFHTFQIGKECSRVVYLEVVTAYLKGYTPQQIQALIGKLETIGKRAGCDEVSHEVEELAFTIRYWFD